MPTPPGTPIRDIVNVSDPGREVGDVVPFLGTVPPEGWEWADPLEAEFAAEAASPPESPEI